MWERLLGWLGRLFGSARQLSENPEVRKFLANLALQVAILIAGLIKALLEGWAAKSAGAPPGTSPPGTSPPSNAAGA